MATQTLPHVAQFPQSVPAVEPITQLELGLFVSLRDRAQEIQKQVDDEEVEVEETPEAPAEAELAPEEEELEIVEEKFYDLNLNRIWNAPREKRTPRAVRFLREFVSNRMKTTEVSISEAANSMLWQRGISKPPRHIRIRVVKDKEGRVIVFPGEGK